MNKVINTFWGKVEIIEVSKNKCKAVLNGKEICKMHCSINDDEEKILQKLHSTINQMKTQAMYL